MVQYGRKHVRESDGTTVGVDTVIVESYDTVNKALRTSGSIPTGYTEIIIKNKQAAIADGKATLTITLGSGTNKIVKEVSMSVGAVGNEWGADGYFQVHRTAGTPDESDPSTSLLGETYLNNSKSLTLAGNIAGATTALKIVYDHNAGSAKDVRFVVRYFFE